MSAGCAVSKEWSPKIAAQGAVVIDNSSRWRYDPDVPLIVPEVNADAVAGFRKRGIIANPNCSTAQLVVALKPLHDKAKIKRVVVATYQSVSGAGKDGMDELFTQTKAVFTSARSRPRSFPSASPSTSSRRSTSSWRTATPRKSGRWWSRPRRFSIPRSSSSATCVRVPVFIGHSEAVNIEFEKPITRRRGARHPAQRAGLPRHRQARARRLRHAATNAPAKTRPISAASARTPTVENGLALWCVSDNLRKGAALNAIQIAECLINRKLIQAKRKAA